MGVLESYRREKLSPGRSRPPRLGREPWPGKHAPATRATKYATNGGTAAVSDGQKIASRIASLPDDEVRHRYHELVDQRLGGELTLLERFELERIETRLDAEDRDSQIDERDRQWEIERTELLESIKDLLSKLGK